MQPLLSTILDLDHALGGQANLIIGGGLGLYLKQEHLRQSGVQTLLPLPKLPPARVTRDIDMFLRAEIVADAERFRQIRSTLDSLGFTPIDGGKYFQFTRNVGATRVDIDLLLGPCETHAGEIRISGERARPKKQNPKVELHARHTPDALSIEADAMPMPISGNRATGGQSHTCQVMIPCPFTYAIMKLGALDDRLNDQNKNDGRHHAMDLYRIVGLQTENEEDQSKRLAKEFANDPQLQAALARIESLFATPKSPGSLRLLEYQRDNPGVPPIDLDWFESELRELLKGA